MCGAQSTTMTTFGGYWCKSRVNLLMLKTAVGLTAGSFAQLLPSGQLANEHRRRLHGIQPTRAKRRPFPAAITRLVYPPPIQGFFKVSPFPSPSANKVCPKNPAQFLLVLSPQNPP